MTFDDVSLHRPLAAADIRPRTAARRIAAALLALHGLVHLIGFVVPWRVAQVEGFAYRTTAFDGAIELGEAGALVIGLAWLAIAVGFVIAAVGVWQARAWAIPLTGVLAVASLAVCVMGLPETVAGIVLDVAILGAVAWTARAHRASRSTGA
jgi:predicted cation transporter